MTTSAVKVSGLTVIYGKDTILELSRLEFKKGKVHVLVGPNGAGKTTLLRAINGLQQPASGSVQVLGRDIYRLPRKERLQVARRMTFCFQKPCLFNASVRRNIEYGLRFREIGTADKEKRVEAVVEAMNLSMLQERNARTLSAGETQRVSLARALVLQPELVLLDEPLANVDDPNKSRVEAAILDLQARGSTVIVATHQVGQAYRLSASVVRLEGGRIAPPALENLLEGEIVDHDGGAALVLAGGISVYVVTEKRGFARASVDPASIIVSKEEIQSSARNSFTGRVVALEELPQRIALTVDVGRDSPQRHGEHGGKPRENKINEKDKEKDFSVSPWLNRGSRTGYVLSAHITTESFTALDITLASSLFLTFKASSVTVF